MGAPVGRVLLLVGAMNALGCGGDSFQPKELHGASGTNAAPSSAAGGTAPNVGATGGAEGRSPNGSATGGSSADMPIVPGTGGTPFASGGARAETGGVPPNATGGAAGRPSASGGSGAAGGVSACPSSGTPSLEQVVDSCVPDGQTRARMYRCAGSLAESWQEAAGNYLACTGCDQVRAQLDCLLRTCSVDADGVLTVQDLIDHCAGTVLASAAISR